ncbi:ETEC_3214 domain-containing protein [Streptomyces sp. NPDC090131]|uniref:ETEC_3214 domain-containing protein n=1 Tax=Streptomyces sp. NPDC090131 TaxID=3365954 RepID=UPI0037FF7103
MTFLPTIDTKLNVWTLAAVLTALYTLFGLARGWWRSSLGKRRQLIKAYRRMAPYVCHDYVKDLFGEPAWEHKQTVQKYGADERDEAVLQDLQLTVRTWPLGTLGFLVTWSNEHDEVLMYSLTTRSRLFRPRVAVGPHRITLGRTPLASLPAPRPDAAGPWPALGARRFSYAEQHYFGSSDGYLDRVVGVSDAGSPAAPPIGSDGEGWDSDELAAYRRQARINSTLVVGSTIDLASVLPYGIAPDYDRVRLLELRHPARVALAGRYGAVKRSVQGWKDRRRGQ